MIQIFPSLIAADLLNLEAEIKTLEPYVDGFHVDVMDNHFVPNITWGIDMITAITKSTTKKIWVHLMIENPLSCIKKMTLPHDSMVTFHIESKTNITETICAISEKKWLPGIAINPKTPFKETKPFLHLIHHLLPMSVNPGFSGQLFLPHTIDIISNIHTYKKENNYSFIITGDGGINTKTIASLYQNGVTHFAIASAIFSHKNRIQAVKNLKKLIR